MSKTASIINSALNLLEEMKEGYEPNWENLPNEAIKALRNQDPEDFGRRMAPSMEKLTAKEQATTCLALYMWYQELHN